MCEQKRLKGGFGVGCFGSVSQTTKELEAWENMGLGPTAALVGPIIFVMSSTSHGDVKVCVVGLTYIFNDSCSHHHHLDPFFSAETLYGLDINFYHKHQVLYILCMILVTE